MSDALSPDPSIPPLNVVAELTGIIQQSGRGLGVTVDAVLELGLKRLGLEYGVLARVEGERYEVVRFVAPPGTPLERGQVFDLGATYCREVVRTRKPVCVAYVAKSDMREHPAYRQYGLEAYFGVPILVAGRPWGVMDLSSMTPRPRPFDAKDLEAIELLGAWVGVEIERQELIDAEMKATQAAEKSRWLTQSVLDHLPARVWFKDAANNILLVNATAASAVNATPQEMINQPTSRYYPDEAEEFYKTDLEVIRSRSPKLGIITQGYDASGAIVFLQTDKLPVFGDDGRVQGVLVVSTDITHVQQAQARAIALAERFEAFMSNSPAMKWAIDEQGRYVFMNSNYARVMRVDAKTAIGKRPDEVLAKQTTQAFLESSQRTNLQAAEQGGTVNFHIDVPIEDDLIPMYVSKFVFHDAEGRRLIGGSAMDLSEVSRVEAELRESEERFRQAFDNAPIGLALVSPEGKWLQVNAALTTQLGYTTEELLAIDFQTLTHPEDLDKDLELVFQVLDDRIRFYQIDKRYFHKSGRTVWARLSVSLVRSPRSGKPLYFISQIEDITRQREFEQELARRNSDLETLLYVISHDLREPLRSIRNFSAIVRTDYRDALDDRGQDMLERVMRGASRLDTLLADVLTLSRAQRADLSSQRVSAETVVRQVASEFQSVIEDTGATIHIAEDLPSIRIDELWLRRAVYNLLSNALKFSRPGESPQIEVLAYRPPPDNRRALRAGPAQVGLVVADRGPGVPVDLREKIFGLFQRGVGRDVPGTGAGLAIVAQIAERYGGRAWVRGREGGGAEFILTFTD